VDIVYTEQISACSTEYEACHSLGPPIVADQTVMLKGNELLLSSLFYSVPHPENPIWYASNKDRAKTLQ
jgi:hypothetical protein